MADAETAGCTREATVGDQSDFITHALAVERCRGRKHFPHPGPAAGSIVADDQHVALFIGFALDGLETGLLAVEAARRSGKFQPMHPGDLYDRPFGSEIAFQTD